MSIPSVLGIAGEFTEEKQKQLLGTVFKFLGADGKLPEIQQIITTAREFFFFF